jgi:hypothetical protein
MNTASNSNDTCFGGRTTEVLLASGGQETIRVRQILLTEYPAAIPLLGDEIALTAFMCRPQSGEDVKPFDKAWALKLQPESYEQIQAIAKEVNAKGFFSYAARYLEKERAEEERWARAAGDMPPEFLERAIELGRSRTTAPRPR